jgi:hypothetical protein
MLQALTADIVKLIYKPETVAAELGAILQAAKIGVAPGALCKEGVHEYALLVFVLTIDDIIESLHGVHC